MSFHITPSSSTVNRFINDQEPPVNKSNSDKKIIKKNNRQQKTSCNAKDKVTDAVGKAALKPAKSKCDDCKNFQNNPEKYPDIEDIFNI